MSHCFEIITAIRLLIKPTLLFSLTHRYVIDWWNASDFFKRAAHHDTEMALRLNKKDVVTKSSYYVWFLGAEEARGLRGGRVLLPVIPYLVERSREIEPIKVTLQVSSKGMKIIQVRAD